MGTEADFGENQPTKTQLLTSMSQSEMLANLNAATVVATLSDENTQDVAVNWLSVEKDENDGKWYATGMAGGIGCLHSQYARYFFHDFAAAYRWKLGRTELF